MTHWSPRPLVAALDAGAHLVGRQGERRGELLAHRVVVGEGLAARLGLLAQRLELLGRVEGVVGPSGIDELEGVLEVDFAALALAVGGVGTAHADALVDFDAAPLERVEDVLLGARDEAVRIGILDAEQHHAAVVAGEEVVVECRADAADVQRAGGAGCEAHPNGSFHIVFQILNILAQAFRARLRARFAYSFFVSCGSPLRAAAHTCGRRARAGVRSVAVGGGRCRVRVRNGSVFTPAPVPGWRLRAVPLRGGPVFGWCGRPRRLPQPSAVAVGRRCAGFQPVGRVSSPPPPLGAAT